MPCHEKVKTLSIHTDGSSLGNPGPGGWAAIIRDGVKEQVLSGNEACTTNNRMEKKAILEALKWVKLNKKNVHKIQVFSDSRLVIESLNKNWKRKNNLDLWAEMDAARNGVTCEWHWVKGHAGNENNERCDQVAVSEAEKAKTKGSKNYSILSPKKQSKELFFCGFCQKGSLGKLGFLPDSGMVRVDCPHCGRYLKFAPPTRENLKRAKSRPLVSKRQIDEIIKRREDKGQKVSENELKKIKAMTMAEIKQQEETRQGLF